MHFKNKLVVVALIGMLLVPGVSLASTSASASASATSPSIASLQTLIASLLAQVQVLEAQLLKQSGSAPVTSNATSTSTSPALPYSLSVSGIATGQSITPDYPVNFSFTASPVGNYAFDYVMIPEGTTTVNSADPDYDASKGGYVIGSNIPSTPVGTFSPSSLAIPQYDVPFGAYHLAVMMFSTSSVASGNTSATNALAIGNSNSFNFIAATSTPVSPSGLANVQWIPSSCNFTYTQGAAVPAEQSGLYVDTSNVVVNYTITVPNQPSWFNVGFATQQLSLVPHDPSGAGCSVDPTGLAPGTYTTHVVYTGNFVGSPFSFPVTLTVLPAAATSTTSQLTMISPNGGEAWQLGTTQTIKWTDSAPNSTSTYTVYVTQQNGSAIGVVGIANGNTQLAWNVGTLTNGTTLTPGSSYYVQIVKQYVPGGGVYVQSAGPFSITAPVTVCPAWGCNGPILTPIQGASVLSIANISGFQGTYSVSQSFSFTVNALQANNKSADSQDGFLVSAYIHPVGGSDISGAVGSYNPATGLWTVNLSTPNTPGTYALDVAASCNSSLCAGQYPNPSSQAHQTLSMVVQSAICPVWGCTMPTSTPIQIPTSTSPICPAWGCNGPILTPIIGAPAAGQLSVTPSSISIGPSTTTPNLTVANIGPAGSSINWTTAGIPSGITVSPTGGTLAGGASQQVTVTYSSSAVAGNETLYFYPTAAISGTSADGTPVVISLTVSSGLTPVRPPVIVSPNPVRGVPIQVNSSLDESATPNAQTAIVEQSLQGLITGLSNLIKSL